MTTRRKQKHKRFLAILIFMSLAMLDLPSSALAAGRGGGRGGGSGSFGGVSRSFGGSGPFRHGNRFDNFRDRRFFGPGFVDGFGFGGADVVIEQSQSTPGVAPATPANKGRCVQPRWVDGGYGVEVLQPGYWTRVDNETKH